MGKYVCNYNNKANCIKMVLSGFFTEDDGKNYARDFMTLAEKYPSKGAYLEIDAGCLDLHPIDVKTALKGVFEMYKQCQYKLIRFKLFKAQKEFARQVKLLCEELELTFDVVYR